MTSLKRKWLNAVTRTMDTRGRPAKLGRTDGTLYFTDSGGTLHRDRVWARIGEGDNRPEQVVYCYSVAPQHDLPVIVDEVNGVTTVIYVDDPRAVVFNNGRPVGGGGPHAGDHDRLGSDPLYVSGLQFLPGLVVPTNPASLAVTVKQISFRYQGDDFIFQEANTGSLSAYIPGTAANKHFVIVCLDRSTNALAIVDGDDISASGDALFGGGTLTAGDVQTVLTAGISDAYWPLAAVLLYNGQTEIKVRDIVMDLQPRGGEGDAGSGTYLPLAGGTLTGALIIDGSADTEQLHVQGNATQNDLIILVEESNGVDLMTLDASGQLALPIAGSGAGLAINDTQLYRSAADVLRTPDTFVVDGSLGVAGTPSFKHHVYVNDATTAWGANAAVAAAFTNEDTTDNSWAIFGFSTRTTTAALRGAAYISAQFTDHTNGSVDADLVMHTSQNNSITEKLRIKNDGRVGIGTSGDPATSAKLEIGGTDGALLVPRMTSTQRDALTAANGMIIYNTTTNTMQGRINGAWTDM